jgi:hypothetical protein
MAPLLNVNAVMFCRAFPGDFRQKKMENKKMTKEKENGTALQQLVSVKRNLEKNGSFFRGSPRL